MIDRATREKAIGILRILRSEMKVSVEDFASLLVARDTADPFRVLIVTILSQSCTDVNALQAYRRLERTVGVTPDKLASAKVQTVKSAIRIGGLQRQKAKAIVELSRIVKERFNDHLKGLLEMPVDFAREKLMDLPKVGPKTADVLLSVWRKPTVAVDTHVDRVSKRLGFAPHKAGYDNVRKALMNSFPRTNWTDLPLLLIALGRSICKARRPMCPICPVNKLCSYPYKTRLIHAKSQAVL